MEIRIGFADTQRELVIKCAGSQEELSQRINAALTAPGASGEPGADALLELADEKGRQYFIRRDRIIFVEIGSAKPHAVGFAGA